MDMAPNYLDLHKYIPTIVYATSLQMNISFI